MQKSKLPKFSVQAVESYFQKIDNTPFENSFLLIQFYISRLLCSNRVKILNDKLEMDTYPNLYHLTLAPSGSSKDKHRKLLEKMLSFFFKDLDGREEIFRTDREKELELEAEEKNLSKTKAQQFVRDNMPRSLYSVVKSNATPEGLGAVHDALYQAKFGCVMWLDKEISDTMARFRAGSPLDELTTMIKESYDNGDFEPKLIKGERMIKALGCIPYVAWVHGAIDDEGRQELFRKFFNLGYARRMIICLSEKREKDNRTLDEIDKDLDNAQKERIFIERGLKEIYNRTALINKFPNKNNFTLSKETERRYMEYKQVCENRAEELSRHTSGIVKDEMGNRYWKAIKLACVYQVQETTDFVISKQSFDMAIQTIEHFGKHLSKFMEMRSEISLPEMMIHSLRTAENGMKKTDFYNTHYFPKFSSGQGKVLKENLDIVKELLALTDEFLVEEEPDKRTIIYSIAKDLPEDWEMIKAALEKGNEKGLVKKYGQETVDKIKSL